MKRKLVTLLTACVLLVGCGNTNVPQTLPEETEGKELDSEQDAVTEESVSDVSSEAASEASTAEVTVELSSIDLLKGFLGIEDESAKAISDVDISIDSYDGVHYFDYAPGAEISIDELKNGVSKSGWGENMKISYTFIYEETENPILVLLIPDNPNYTDENFCIMVFAAKDGEVHLVSYKDYLTDESTYGYVGKNGLLSYRSHPMGRSSSNVLVNNSYVVEADGQIKELFNETMAVPSEAAYMADEHRVFAIFSEMYGEDNYSHISVLHCGSEDYYTLYSDGSNNSLDFSFVDACEKEGIKVYNREELLLKVNEYIKGLGYDIDVSALDENAASWQQL